MKLIRSVSIAALVVVAAQAAGAQAQWTFDAGAYARWNSLASSYETNTGFGGGVRLGVFVIPRLELEVDASSSSNAGKSGSALGDLTYTPIAVRAEYFYPVKDRFAVMLGLGYAQEKFSGGLDAKDWAWATVVGVRATFKQNWYALLDYTANYSATAANPSSAVTSTWNTGLELGVGYLFEFKKDKK
jgi:hypothetical protein